MNSWVADTIALRRPSNTFTGIMTASQVRDPIGITASAALHGFRVDIVLSAVTVVGAISLILQHSSDGTNWANTKTAVVTTSGVQEIKFLPNVAGDQAFMPIKPLIRLVATTTNAGDTFTVDSLLLMVER